MTIRARKAKRVVALTLGVVALGAGFVGVANFFDERGYWITAVLGYGLAAILFRYARHLRPASARPRVPSALLLLAGVALLTAAGYMIARPVHGLFSHKACGSGLVSRSFAADDFARYDCEDEVVAARAEAVALFQAGLIPLVVAARRPRRPRPNRGLLVGAVSLSMIGLTSLPALAAQREVDFVESLREEKAARPAADAVCAAMAGWGRNVGLGAQRLQDAAKNATVAQDQEARIAYIAGLHADLVQVVATIDAVTAEFGSVPGVSTFVGYLRTLYAPMADVFGRAEAVLRSEPAHTRRELRALTDRARDVLAGFDEPDPTELLGRSADHDAAEVGLAFERSSECFGIF